MRKNIVDTELPVKQTEEDIHSKDGEEKAVDPEVIAKAEKPGENFPPGNDKDFYDDGSDS